MAEEVEFVVTDWEYQDAGTDDWQEWDLTANFRITNPTPYPAKVLYELRALGKQGRSMMNQILETTYDVEVGAGESLVRSVNARVRIQYPEDSYVDFQGFANSAGIGVVSMFGEHDSGVEPYWLDLRRSGHTYRC